ncbi:MAG TPA: helix-turn-helix domain-containing protein [Planctomycetaceae bacterium]|nr:helix-turn-helix domain-containing protein [Planctomycetaceae bacterium]
MGKKAVDCPAETALRVLEGRWKLLMLRQLLEGTRRFSELHRSLAGVSHRTLTQQLRELEEAGIIRRKVYRQVPPKVEYSLTPLGQTLEPVIDALHIWAETRGRFRAPDRCRRAHDQRIHISVTETSNRPVAL